MVNDHFSFIALILQRCATPVGVKSILKHSGGVRDIVHPVAVTKYVIKNRYGLKKTVVFLDLFKKLIFY